MHESLKKIGCGGVLAAVLYCCVPPELKGFAIEIKAPEYPYSHPHGEERIPKPEQATPYQSAIVATSGIIATSMFVG
jgi:hypothetical protein